MEELTKKIREFAEERDWLQFNTPENLAKSISIEAGELLECFQWNNSYDKNELKYEIAEEIGVLDKVFEQGWGALSSKESGKIGGLLAKKNKTHKSI